MRKISILSICIVASMTSFGQKPACEEGVVINGVKWATRNVDEFGTFVKNPEDAGKFYQWNRKKAWELSNDWVTGWDSTAQMGVEWEKDNDPSPKGWRVPTIDEIKSLFDTDKVKNEWITINGIDGRKFTEIKNGNSIFLPAAGFCRWNDGVRMFIGRACYWSSTSLDNNTERAFGLDDLKGQANEFTAFEAIGRAHGQLIRPVADEK